MTFRVDVNTGSALVPVWYDVSSFVRSWMFSRGRDRFLSGFSAGSCEVTFDNRLRTFDPLNGSSPVQSAVVPRGQVRLFWDYAVAPGGVRTNLALNPSVETNTTYWSTDGILQRYTLTERVDAPFGVYAIGPRVKSVSTYVQTQLASLSTETEYAISAYVLSAVDVTVSIVYGATVVDLGTVSAGTAWTRFSAFVTTPTSVGATQYIRFSYASTSVASIYFDGVLVEQAQELLDYFDGSFTDTDINEYAWTGTAHNSTSTDSFDIETGHQYVGYITDWNLSYDVRGDSTATLQAADGFTLLANQQVPDATQPLEQTGTRINRLLNSGTIQWPAQRRSIQAGNRFLTTDTTDGDNALSYFQQIALTELGELFVAKNGDLTYRGSDVNNPSPADVVATFADDGTGIAFQTIAVEYGSEQLTNRFTVTWVGGDVQDDNLTSQALYGVTEDSATTLAQNLTDAASLAGYYVNRFGQPLYRIQQVSMYVPNLSLSDRATVLDLELGDVVLVKFTPNGLGSSIDQYAKITRISQSGEGVEHYITFGLEAFTTFPLVLGDATYGELGSTYVLGF